MTTPKRLPTSRKSPEVFERHTAVAMPFIRNYIKEKGYPPTLREIGAACGTSSSSSIQDIVNYMIGKGLISVDPGKSRAMRVNAVADVETM